MIYGVNLTSPRSWTVTQDLRASGHVAFAEILLDDFLHMDPYRIADDIKGLPVAFHIMQSRFLDKPPEQMRALATLIRRFIEILKPIYVSDHVARFEYEGHSFALTEEFDYESEWSVAVERTTQWQETLRCQLHLENFPSETSFGLRQPEFFSALCAETKCGILFDISNAVIAQFNGGARVFDWVPLARHISRIHVGGYRPSETTPVIMLDTHDQKISQETLDGLGQILALATPVSAVVERDANIDHKAWADDIALVDKEFRRVGTIC